MPVRDTNLEKKPTAMICFNSERHNNHASYLHTETLLHFRKCIFCLKERRETHREALADVSLPLRGRHSRTFSVVHIAGHVASVLTELDTHMRPVLSGGHAAAVIQLTGGRRRYEAAEA